MPSARLAVSIVVPTYREAENIGPLIERIFGAMPATSWDPELIIVDDDSQDGTDRLVAQLAAKYPVRLVVRRKERGLAGAVLAGFREAASDHFVVLDADLQHPPEMIPALLEPLQDPQCDMVVATRYSRGGAVAGHWPLRRRLASRVATLLARPLVPISDPMSGFFALRRSTWERAEKLNPVGYKIALELYVKARCRRAAEVPIVFQARAAGSSKFGLRQQVHYLHHLARLYWYRFPRPCLVLLGIAILGLAAAVLWIVLDGMD